MGRSGISTEDDGNLKYFGPHVLGDEVYPPDHPEILKWVKHVKWSTGKAPVIIIDALIRFLPEDGDENSTKDIKKLWRQLAKLKNLGCAVIVLHHTGKGDSTKKTGGRGSSDIPAGANFVFMITNPGKDGADLVKMEITRQKKRNNYPFGLDGKMTVNLSESGELTAESINQPLIDLLRKNPDITGSDFEDLAQKAKIGGGQKAVRKFLKEGVKTGHISERAGERTSKHFTWMAVDSDPQKMRKADAPKAASTVVERKQRVAKDFKPHVASRPLTEDDDDDEPREYTIDDLNDWHQYDEAEFDEDAAVYASEMEAE